MYYTNALRNLPKKPLTRSMWSGRNAWTVPYARGALYFADLDARLKRHRSQVDVLGLVNETSKRIGSGAPANNQTWRDVLASHVGAWAVSDWSDMLQGRLLLPVDAFGETVEGHTIESGFFDLGFAKPERLNAGARIEELKPGSPAAIAGLREGDVLTESLDLNPSYRSYGTAITLHVLRDNIPQSITYNPRAGFYPAIKWALSSR